MRKLSLFLFLFTILLFSCSTEKNRFINRAYHSINTKYNGYFNAREIYNNSLKTLSDAHLDNYEEVLSIFQYGNSQNRSTLSSNMETIYEKCSRVIRKHSMDINGVEYNRYIDNAYFLIARSHFFKDDFNLAIIMFEYVIRQYDTQLKYESMIWIAKARHQLEQYDRAAEMLELVEQRYEQGLLENNAKQLYYLVRADHNIRTEKYGIAAEYLNNGIRLTKNREYRTRLTFILGQVYYRAENFYDAQRSFARVLRMNPDFDMAFRARINMAMSYDPRMENVKEVREGLYRMLNVDRNRDYRDEIYYALGMLELRQGNESSAIDYFLESTRVSERNDFQKGLSFLRLGELHYEMPEYYKASVYYDSVVTFMSRDYDDFERIQKRQKLLFELASYIRIIEREDSLQRLAGMSSSERNKIIDGIISELREQERLEREKERERQRQMQQMRGRDAGRAGQRDGNGGWYFYNTTAMNFGKTEFYAKWGDRPLEDLWRISNKQMMSFGFDPDDPDAPLMDDEPVDKLSRDTYLANIPSSEEDIKNSNNRIANAYYNKGVIFKTRLNDKENAVGSFNTLIERFPEFEQKIYAYYYLYTINMSSGNASMADVYKNRIISEFPDSDFAKILKDPDYAKNIIERRSRAERVYQQTYNAFYAGNYQQVINYSSQIDTLEMDKPIKARFLYLNAMAQGKMDETLEMKQQLAYIVEHYDGTGVHDRALTLLNILNERAMIAGTTETDEKEVDEEEIDHFESIYTYNPDDIHFFAIVIESNYIQLRDIRNKLNSYNRDEFPDENLSLSNINLNVRQQLITVTNFKGKEKALDYYGSLFENEVLVDFDIMHYEAFVISVENYPTFYQHKDLSEYLDFYRHYYFK